ncbi:PIR Superfamily Protein [Plasmodium ovale curtisi]|uniref:PIR Superfamily Protein n=1 Tax=Plasmodium ovale curtisi TaxID=864141 RepID=A0A1A8WJB2_PLAOA|nr:PIR Superfamily Protein [Plasmodium ovale curtisi]
MDSNKDEEYYQVVSFFTKFDNKFDIKTSSFHSEYNSFCNTIGSSHFNDKNAFISPCTYFAKYLKDLERTYQNDDRRNRCMYLNYCLNDVSNVAKYHTYDYADLFSAYKDVSSKLDVCKDQIEIIDPDVFEKVKVLYELYHNVHNIKKGEDTSTNIDCDKAKECFTYYREHLEVCNTNSNNAYCQELTKFKKVYDHIMEDIISCENVPQVLPPIKNDSFNAVVLTSFILISATIFILFIIYKFTPFGSWIYLRIQRKKKLWNNLYDKALQFFDKTKQQSLISQGNRFNIQYDSSRNS